MTQKRTILLIGYGNPGRLDDGLGPALADQIEKLQLPHVDVEADYQLTVEDAAYVAEHDVVIFADASVNGNEPFFFQQIQPKTEVSFSSHSVDPHAVLGLAHDLFSAKTKGYVLGIRGYEFNEFGEQLSAAAKNNLFEAYAFLSEVLTTEDFQSKCTVSDSCPTDYKGNC